MNDGLGYNLGVLRGKNAQKGRGGRVQTWLWLWSPVLAQTAQVPEFPGSTGWVGAGLLGAVLAWLLGRFIPKLIENYQNTIAATNERHSEEMSKARDEFRQALHQLMLQNEKDIQAILAAFDRESIRHHESLLRVEVVIQRTLDRLESDARGGRHKPSGGGKEQ